MNIFNLLDNKSYVLLSKSLSSSLRFSVLRNLCHLKCYYKLKFQATKIAECFRFLRVSLAVLEKNLLSFEYPSIRLTLTSDSFHFKCQNSWLLSEWFLWKHGITSNNLKFKATNTSCVNCKYLQNITIWIRGPYRKLDFVTFISFFFFFASKNTTTWIFTYLEMYFRTGSIWLRSRIK